MIGGLKKLDLKNQEKLKKKWMFDKYDNMNGKDMYRIIERRKNNIRDKDNEHKESKIMYEDTIEKANDLFELGLIFSSMLLKKDHIWFCI